MVLKMIVPEFQRERFLEQFLAIFYFMKTIKSVLPEWVSSAVFYQIFPDRFCKSKKYKAVGQFANWEDVPTRENMYGGNLAGIIEKLDYIKTLGANAIYLCPIFKSNSNHRYHTVDYFEIDPVLGSLKDFDNLIKKAHAKGLRIILDGVFNHASRGFFQFNSLMELGQSSPYRDWFHVHSWPIKAYNGRPNYECWWGMPALPKFNTNNPEVREFLFSVGEYWIKRGIDGWRLDVPNEIDDDSFWREFRVRVKRINPSAYIVGEIWDDPSRWLQGDEFDGVMNYPLRKAVNEFLFEKDEISLEHFAERLNAAFTKNRWGIPFNLVGSHDTTRIASLPCANEKRVSLAFHLIFFLPGTPCIYYGDEISLKGGKDPDNRRTMPWETLQKGALYKTLQKLAAQKRENEILQKGTLSCELKNGVLEMVRSYKKKKLKLRIFDRENFEVLGF